MATKTSIIVFYLSFSKEEKVFRMCNYLTLLVVNVAGFALTITSIAQCRPVSAAFKYPIPTSAKCIDIVALYLSSAPVNVSTDLALLFLPMPILTRMRLPKKQKIILVVTFGCGIFVAAVDVVRIAYLQSAAVARVQDSNSVTGSSSRIREEEDFSWYASLSFMWSAVEVNMGIIVACVPSLRPLFMRFLPSWIRDEGSSGSLRSPESDSRDSTTVRSSNLNPITNPAAATQNGPSDAAASGDGNMGFMEFLSTSENDKPLERISTNRTNSRSSWTSTWRSGTSRRAPTFHDFVNVRHPRNMLRLSNRESFMPVLVVSVLFLLWGIAYGFLNVLNSKVSSILLLDQGQTLGLHASYYGGYFIGPLTSGRWVLKKYGFKSTMMTGLVIYAIGSLVFWPSAVLTSYSGFIVSNVIVGFGLSNLEVAANPFIALCGPLEYAEIRLNLSQGVQAIGSVASPVLAQKVLFRTVLDAPSLIDVQWAYLGIALFDVFLAVILFYVSLPEASDENFDELADRRRAVYTAKVGGRLPVVWVTLALGVFSQWCYVGGQESIGTNTEGLIIALKPAGSPRLAPFDYTTIGHTVFAVGRFLTALLNYLFTPRWILLGLYVGVIISTILTMTLTGTASIAMLMVVYLFESGIFSVIFAISLRGMGIHTKSASAFMTAAISGGAIFNVIQSAVANGHGERYSFCVPAAVFAFGLLFPIYLNLIPQAKSQVDPIHDSRRTRPNRPNGRKETATRLSQASVDTNRNAFGYKGILARYQRRKAKREVEKESQDPRVDEPKQASDINPASPEWESGSAVTDFAQYDFGDKGDSPLEILGQGRLSEIDPADVEKAKSQEVERSGTSTIKTPTMGDDEDDTDSFAEDSGQGRLKLSSPAGSEKATGSHVTSQNFDRPTTPRLLKLSTPPDPSKRRVSFADVGTQDSSTEPPRSPRPPRSPKIPEDDPGKKNWDVELGQEVHDFAPWPDNKT